MIDWSASGTVWWTDNCILSSNSRSRNAFGMKIDKYVDYYIWHFSIKNTHFNKFITFADFGIFLDKTEQYHLVTKITLFGNVIWFLIQNWVAKVIRLVFPQAQVLPQHPHPLKKISTSTTTCTHMKYIRVW